MASRKRQREQYSSDEETDHQHHGFEDWDKEELRKVARIGGKHSHMGSARRRKDSRGRKYEEEDYSSEEEDTQPKRGRKTDHRHHGFEDWDKDELRRVARIGGLHSHGIYGKKDKSSRRKYEDESESEDESGEQQRTRRYKSEGKRESDHQHHGFEDWDKEELRKVARIGGLHSHGIYGKKKSSSSKRPKYEYEDEHSEDEGEEPHRYNLRSYDSKKKSSSKRSGRKYAKYDEEESASDDEEPQQRSYAKTGRKKKTTDHRHHGFEDWDKDELRRVARLGGMHSHDHQHSRRRARV